MDQSDEPRSNQYETLSVTYKGHLAFITLDRPAALNSMNAAFWREFPGAVRDIDEKGEARALIINAAGKHFCAGMDLAVFKAMGQSFRGDPARRAEQMRRKVLFLQDAFNALEDIRIPVLAAVQGAAIGGAVDLLCACDMRYCTTDAYFSVKETQLAMTADLGTLQRLPRLIPMGLAKELAYTGRDLTSSQALQAGFVNNVYDDRDALMEGVTQIAQDIASQSPMAVAGTKKMINYAADHSVADSLNFMATWQAGMFQMEDVQTAMQARQNKQTPQYAPLKPGITSIDD
ncbi:crotonase/enoyl-CoA hydratase family protein [Salinimonas sp. HHU 13199]|uniref:Crotonase/enoyl-CoA hydratase family protein n=1 Tax=Salinimonas profundi TaxID=2729140 RepID=A0ABR8LF27_9ALTE|nr:crotonase/enoyl-CoA hydratase family protein [Salinimonas profundi]MBD3584138.1 crotonase/enoyl-CoA hydratase family protein [Salinimonas profundi]